MPSNFPVIQGLLREFVQDDITAGLAKVISDLRSGWKSPYDTLARGQRNRMKKLKPAQRAAIQQMVDKEVEAKIENPILKSIGSVESIVKQINTRQEAEAVLGGLEAVARGIQLIDQRFVNVCEGAGYITAEEAQLFIEQNRTFREIPLGPKTMAFIREHRRMFVSMLDLDENLLVDVDGGAALLRQAIEQTPEDGPEGRTRKDAVLGTHYLLYATSVAIHEMFNQLVEAIKKRQLPDEEAEAKTTAPAAPAAPKK